MQTLAWEKLTPKDVAYEGSSTNRGFTQHEMLDTVDLVHMNGRVYDPQLGRFVSADPNVFQPANLQDFNRYSYVHKNPLSATDPSGFELTTLLDDKLSMSFMEGINFSAGNRFNWGASDNQSNRVLSLGGVVIRR